MVNIDNDNRNEEKRIEEQRQNSRRESEKRKQVEPMRTFEAKLSEKAALEKGRQNTQTKANKELKQEIDKKQKFLTKVFGSENKSTSSLDVNAKIQEMRLKDGDGEDQKLKNKFSNKLDESKDADGLQQKKDSQKAEQKKGVSDEGHRRVAEKQGDEGSAGFGRGGQEAFAGDDSQGSSFGSDADSQSDSNKNWQQFVSGRGGSASKRVSTSTSFQGGFQKEARDFDRKNLDEIVTAIATGTNAFGEEFLTVEMSDQYFEGLKLKATRTPEGVVVTFHCPNLAVRSTFIKSRHQIYIHLKSKNVSVFRIDVV